MILELMYRAGLRVGEVVKLRPRDVEEDGIIRLYEAKGGDGTAYFDAERIWPMVESWLQRREEWLMELGLDTDWENTNDYPLFINANGTPVTIRYIQRRVKRLKERCGVRGILTPHVFRHTYATELIEEGFTLTEVQSSLRHANLQTTAVYLHVRDETLRKKMSQRQRREEV